MILTWRPFSNRLLSWIMGPVTDKCSLPTSCRACRESSVPCWPFHMKKKKTFFQRFFFFTSLGGSNNFAGSQLGSQTKQNKRWLPTYTQLYMLPVTLTHSLSQPHSVLSRSSHQPRWHTECSLLWHIDLHTTQCFTFLLGH